MGKGSNTTTTQQQQTYNPAGGPQIQSALTQAQNAAQLPFNIPQAPVAGFSQDQQSAFGNINNAQGMAQPYINQAQQYFSPQGAQQFFNPYADAVTAQMQNIFGQQNQQNTSNLVQSAGGVGADRIAVGQGNLANQQSLAAGQTYANLYGQAAQQAQSAGYGTAALGSQAQNAALQGSQAQLASGGLQQQLQQAQMNSPYQQQLAQAAFPYQQAQFLAGITGSLAPGLGGTTTGQGTTTGPSPSLLSQILGLGTAGVGAAGGMGAFSGSGKGSGGVGSYGQGSNATGYGAGTGGMSFPMFARGGGIGFDEGGATSSPFDLPPNFNDKPINVAEHSIIPTVQTPAIRPEVPKLNLNPPAQQQQSGGLGQLLSAGLKLGAMFAAHGGRVNPYARGGVAGFGPGGEVTDEDRAIGYQMLRDGMGTRAPDSIPGGEPAPERYRMQGDPAAYRAWQQGADASMADGTTATPVGFKPAFPPPSGSHGRSVGAPVVEEPADAPQDVSARSRTLPAPQEDTSEGTPANKSGRFVDSPWAALMAAGLGIAGGTSPFAAVNIGQGGLQGLKTLQEQRASGQKDETIEQATRRLDLEAKHHEDQFTRMTPYQKYETSKPVPMGQTIGPLGLPMTTYGIPDGKGGYTPVQAPTPTTQQEADNPVKNIVDGIKSGKLPPDTTGLYRLAPAVKSGLAKDGFDLTQAQLEMAAAKKQILSLNGPQMVRFVGLAKSVDQTINEVKQLSEQMKNSGIPLLNQAKIAELMHLEGNSEKGQLAARYVGAVNTLKEEFANLANGGYAPTEPAWKLANEQINGNYGVKQLGASLEEVQRLIRYRLQGIPNMNTLGPGSNNRYVPGAADSGASHAPASPAAPAPVAVASPEEARKLPSGTLIRLPDGRTGTVP